MTSINEKTAHQRLADLKQQLLQDLERGAEASETVELEQNKVGRLSRMDAMQQQAMQKASQQLIRKRLVQIDQAFKALEEGDYGFCQHCGDEIPDQRLEIRPEALVCVKCQEKIESSS